MSVPEPPAAGVPDQPARLSGQGLPAELASALKRNPDGLVPAIAQDAETGRVLMMAWMNDESLAITLATGQATYWSRSRQELWAKGATSGHLQTVRQVQVDCDGDTLLLQVDQVGPACHTGARSCFDAGPSVLIAPTDHTTGSGQHTPSDDSIRPTQQEGAA